MMDPKSTTAADHRMARSGVYFAPRHNWFISAAHTDRDIEQTLNVTEQAFEAVRKQFGA